MVFYAKKKCFESFSLFWKEGRKDRGREGSDGGNEGRNVEKEGRNRRKEVGRGRRGSRERK